MNIAESRQKLMNLFKAAKITGTYTCNCTWYCASCEPDPSCGRCGYCDCSCDSASYNFSYEELAKKIFNRL